MLSGVDLNQYKTECNILSNEDEAIEDKQAEKGDRGGQLELFKIAD